jgi:hypothetical protein
MQAQAAIANKMRRMPKQDRNQAMLPGIKQRIEIPSAPLIDHTMVLP